MTDDPLKFNSPEELEALLKTLSARLHYINRVAGGESKYIWWLADVLFATGKLAPLMQDRDLKSEFGDGWSAGTDPDPKARILDLLSQNMSNR